MKHLTAKHFVIAVLAFAMAMLCVLPACSQSEQPEHSQDSKSTTSAENQPSEPSPSKGKATKSILDALGDAVDNAREQVEGAANALNDARENAERQFAEWQEQQRQAAAARAAEKAAQTAEALEKAELTRESKVLEYSTKKTEPLDLVTCSDYRIRVSSDGKIDRSSPGTKKVTYTLTLDGQTSQREVKFKIRDTKPPEIDFVNRAPKVNVGAKYNPAKNVNYVKDPIDGKLSKVKAAPKAKGSKAGAERFYDKGWYTVKGDVDTSTPGVYTVDVNAADINGNTSHRSFDVTVAYPAPEPAAPQAAMTKSVPLGRTVYVTSSGKKYHAQGCRYLKSSCIPMNLNDALARGYEPCSVCGG